MGKTSAEIDAVMREFIERQRMFFVASAPSGAAGHVNVSPKGLDTFRVLGPRRAAYLDYNGSGVETIAHVRENGRLTIMFCAFEGRPNIVRLYGTGRVVEPGDGDFDATPSQLMCLSPPRYSIAKTANPTLQFSAGDKHISCDGVEVRLRPSSAFAAR